MSDSIKIDQYITKFLPVYIFDSDETILHQDTIYTVTWTDNKILYISYYILFTLNGEISKCPCVYSSIHKYDVEWITVSLDLETKNINWIYYFQHGSEGKHIFPDDIEYFNDTYRPIVYVALNSHASYHKSGVIFRCLGLANDRANGQGEFWKPSITKDIEYMPEPEKTSKLKSKWFKNVPKFDYPWYKRYFCICWK